MKNHHTSRRAPLPLSLPGATRRGGWLDTMEESNDGRQQKDFEEL